MRVGVGVRVGARLRARVRVADLSRRALSKRSSCSSESRTQSCGLTPVLGLGVGVADKASMAGQGRAAQATDRPRLAGAWGSLSGRSLGPPKRLDHWPRLAEAWGGLRHAPALRGLAGAWGEAWGGACSGAERRPPGRQLAEA